MKQHFEIARLREKERMCEGYANCDEIILL